MTAGDNIRDMMIPGSLFDQLQARNLDAVDLRDNDVQVNQLADISAGDLGPINAGSIDVANGAVIADENGILFSGSASTARQLWNSGPLDTPLYDMGLIYSVHAGGATPNRSSYTHVEAMAESGGTGTANVQLYARNGSTNFSLLALSTAAPILICQDYLSGQQSTLHYGDYAGYTPYSNSASETAVYTRTIKANSLGTKGTFAVIASGWMQNNGYGSSRNAQIRIRFGGLSGALVADTGAISVANNGVLSWNLILTMSNISSASSQVFDVQLFYGTNTSTTLAASTNVRAQVGLAVDTTSDQDFVITNQWATASASLSGQVTGVHMFGPFYGS